jgi:hypothetical protein
LRQPFPDIAILKDSDAAVSYGFVQDLAGNGRGDFTFFGALLDNVQSLDLGGLVRIAIVGKSDL